jgi:hypothetical protein
MNEMVNLIPTCIVSSPKNYSRMILLNSEKQCICMYRGRRKAAAVAAKEEEEEYGGGGGGRRWKRRMTALAAAVEEEEVSLGVIMTNT